MEFGKKAATCALAALLAAGQLNGATRKNGIFFGKIHPLPDKIEQEKPQEKNEKREEKRQIVKIDAKLLKRLQKAFLDEICKIRKEKGLKVMPKMNAKLVDGAQAYSEVVAAYREKGTLEEKMMNFWHDGVGEGFDIRMWKCHAGLKSAGECISSIKSSYPIVGEMELERAARERARGLLRSPPHRAIVLTDGKRLVAGAGLSVSSSERDGIDEFKLVAVYIVGEK